MQKSINMSLNAIMCKFTAKIKYVFIAEYKQRITLSLWQNCDSNKTSRMYDKFERVINKLGVGKDQLNQSDNIINYSSCW